MLLKNSNNDTCMSDVLLPGWTEITREQYDSIIYDRRVIINPKEVIREQILKMEQSQMLPRATREFMLLMMEAQFTPEQLALNFGYSAVKAFDNQIKSLRDQL